MKIFEPEYYRQFRCLAGSCPDSCCQEWTIDVDADSAAFYRALPGALGDRLRSVLQDTEDGTVMVIEDRRCPMWQEDGLCRIQSELGHDALCQTCRDFPRLRHDYGAFVELGLELSCPEAARLIFACGSSAMIVQDAPGGETADYDEEIMGILFASRKTVLDFLDSCALPLSKALAVILLYSHSVQAQLDGGEEAVFNVEKFLRQADCFPLPAADISSFVAFFSDLEILTPRWQDLLQQPSKDIGCSDNLFPLVRYFVQRYWLQAVSDYDLLCRVKFMIISCLLICALGGDSVETSQLFSKEIENDPDNLDAIFDAAYSCPAFTDLHLLALLRNP